MNLQHLNTLNNVITKSLNQSLSEILSDKKFDKSIYAELTAGTKHKTYKPIEDTDFELNLRSSLLNVRI